MKKYIIHHKVKGYTGKSSCVFFVNGIAETDNEWIASWFDRKGHSLELNVDKEELTDENKTSTYIDMTVEELKAIAKEQGIEGSYKLNKAELLEILG